MCCSRSSTEGEASIGRGGGPTYLAIRVTTAGIIRGTLRVTEQGEMLQALFGLTGDRGPQLEVYTTGTLEARVTPRRNRKRGVARLHGPLSGDARRRIDPWSMTTRGSSSTFTRPRPNRSLATEIGSRPARREGGDGIVDPSGDPWEFAWTQTRLFAGAWLGVEDALDRRRYTASSMTLRAMYREWPFWRSTLDLSRWCWPRPTCVSPRAYDRRLCRTRLEQIGERPPGAPGARGQRDPRRHGAPSC